MRRNLTWTLLLTAGLIIAASSRGATLAFDHTANLPKLPRGQALAFGTPQDLREIITQTTQSVLLPLFDGEYCRKISFTCFGDRVVGSIPDISQFIGMPTSDAAEYSNITPALQVGQTPLVVAGETVVNGRRFAEILLSPVWTDPLGNVHAIDSLTIRLDGRELAAPELLNRNEALQANREAVNRLHASTAGATEYLIVTNHALAEAFLSLQQYKSACGITTSIVSIEDILASNDGRDDAERLRNYLKTFYASGGKYVLLGGDGTVVPIRYAYPYAVTTPPALHDQLVCDLYFADMTGEWNTDSDQVWGERYEDQPDATPELYVGRLPVDNPADVKAYVDKLIRYETSPGGDDPSYLTRALFYSSDQMRDWADGGQHGKIASAYPATFTIDTANTIETASGSDPAPTNAGPLELPEVTRSQYGIVNVIAHGRFDGFVLKSAGYNESPKQYVLTQGYDNVQCPFDSLSIESSPAFYYSLACDNGGFDLDRPPFTNASAQMGRALLGSTRGAVAMLANSRWGWTSTSYLLQKSFFDSLFAHPERPAIAAMYAAQMAYWYYRDLVYGQVFLGDPTMHVQANVPRKLSVDPELTAEGCIVAVFSSQGPEGGVTVILADSGTIIASAITGLDGSATLTTGIRLGHTYTISAVGAGTMISYSQFVPSIITSVNDQGNSLPIQYALFQNYPNPFNPSTTISFDLPIATDVTLTLYNVLGQIVDVLVDRKLPAGHHAISWEGSDSHGRQIASGVYYYRLTTKEFSETRKLVLVR
jgi:hypothetical protein